ncbi:MAG: lipopolysaccharide heptosyltransferase II [Phycisphaerae bacterium]|jgi:heptosyltransferase II|nr:lipopolysaccharide heptosyltransferase II [Phycisphaerae bacterium]
MPLPQDIKHLAILMPSWVGDVVMASCVWKMARDAYPEATITAVIRPHLAPLLDNVEEFDNVLPLDMKSSIFAASRKLSEVEADAIILLPNSIRAALIARFAKIKKRIGYKRNWRTWLLTESILVKKYKKPTPTTAYYLHLANEAFGMQETNAIPSLGPVGPEPEVLQTYDHPIVLLVAGASKDKKRWAPKYFAQVADSLSKTGATCVCIGSPDEFELVQEVVKEANTTVHNLTQSGISLGSLPSIIACADLMITNDTGPRHLAVATGTPVITLYGPTDYRWTKYDSANDISLLADPFLPENLVADSNPERCDIDNIPPSDVIASAIPFLKQ